MPACPSPTLHTHATTEQISFCKPDENSWRGWPLALLLANLGLHLQLLCESHYYHLARLDFNSCKGEFDAK